MNLGNITIVLRSRRAMEVVDLSLRFLRHLAPRPYLWLALYTLVPAWLGCVLLRHFFDCSWLVVWSVAWILSSLLELPFLSLAGLLLFDRQASVGRVLREALRLLLPFAMARTMVWVACAFSIVIVIGPLLVAAGYCFVPEALVLERASAWRSLGRARKFLRARSGVGIETVLLRSFFIIAFVLLAEMVLRSVVVDGLDWAIDDEMLFEEGGSTFALLGLFAAVPYTTTFRFLAYINERTRQDGWDVQVALMPLAQGESA